MKLNYKQISVAILAAVILASSAFAKVPKRILMEDHTGAWCGWCVMGNQAMEDMLAQYQDRFIAVAVHNGDGMATALQGTIATKLGLQGYPSGLMNRTSQMVSGQSMLWIHPIYWADLVAAHINDSSIVDVHVTYSLDSVAKTLTATVTATMTDDYNGQLAFNLYLMEDNCTGTGSLWDQHNYLSGNATYKDHPYYSQPAVITNYLHENVMRDMLGGAWGTNGSFPASVKAGETYTQEFTADLSKYAIQNYSNIWVAGMVQQTGSNYAIMNAAESGKVFPKPKYRVQAVNSVEYLSGTRNNTQTKVIQFANSTDKDLVVDFSLDTKKTSMPSDWSVTLSDSKVTIPSKSQKSITASIALGNTASFADVFVNASVEGSEDYEGVTSNAEVGLLSDGVEYGIFYFDGDGVMPLKESIQNLPDLSVKTAAIPYNTTTASVYGNYPFKLLVVAETFASRGSLINSPLINTIASYIQSGKPVLMTSIDDMFFVAGNYSSLTPNLQTSSLFNALGINGFTLSSPMSIGNSSTGSYNIVSLKGVDGDPVTNGMSFNINETNAFHNFGSYWADQVKITNTAIASPILTYDIFGLPAGQNVAAAKIQTATNRDIYMGFSFELMADPTTRGTLFNNMVTWLMGSNDVKDISSMNSADMTITPNPVAANASVKLNSTENAQADIYLIDMSGSRVSSVFSGVLNGGEQNINFTTAGLPSGKYYMISNINGVMSQIAIVVAK